jgi:hypothetical protein
VHTQLLEILKKFVSQYAPKLKYKHFGTNVSIVAVCSWAKSIVKCHVVDRYMYQDNVFDMEPLLNVVFVLMLSTGFGVICT